MDESISNISAFLSNESAVCVFRPAEFSTVLFPASNYTEDEIKYRSTEQLSLKHRGRGLLRHVNGAHSLS